MTSFNKCFRSNHQRCSINKGVLENFANFTRKHLCQSLFFNKAADMRPATLLKKRLWHRFFSCEYNEIFTEHLRTTASGVPIFD